MPSCVSCGTTDAQKYFVIPGTKTMSCESCAKILATSPEPRSPLPQQHLPMFTRWICKKHHCGSYNFNSLGKHEMPWCQIVTEVTVGVIKPKTFGGLNGNLSRHYFSDWQEHSRQADMDIHAVKAWSKYVKDQPKVRKAEKKRKYNPFITRGRKDVDRVGHREFANNANYTQPMVTPT